MLWLLDENIPAVLDDNAVAETGDADMEVLSEQMIKQVVKQLVVLADSSPELLDEVRIDLKLFVYRIA